MDATKYEFVPIEIIDSWEDDSELIDIEVEGTHTFCLEGGYVTHNTAKNARDRKFQAILPLRGKPLNVNDRALNICLANKEIGSIISALGITLTANSVDISDLKYKKIILMCFTGDTKIPLLNGKIHTIKELVNGDAGDEFWLYSMENNKMTPGLGYKPRKTGEVTELVEIEFDDGSIIKCTPEHKWVMKEGDEVLAKNLKIDDSLFSFHRRDSNFGYDQIFDQESKKWINTHTLVASEYWPEEYEDVNSKRATVKTRDYPIVHHVDFDKRNNNPENLLWCPCDEHFDYHSKIGTEQIIAYNISDKHKERVKELHKQGHYKDYTWKDTYNGSKKHLEAVAKAWRDEEKREKMLTGPKGYAGSKLNSETATKRNKKMWENDEYREKMLKVLRDSNDPETISKRTIEQWKKDGMKDKMIKGKVLKLLNKLINEGYKYEELKKEFNLKKAKNTISIESAIERWGDGIFEEALCYNRRIVNVKTVKLDKPVPVYNLIVAGTHNYMLENGVITKNCDADPDGGHISCLLITLFYKYMRKIIEEGNLYLCDLPLYRVQWKGKSKYLKDDTALYNFKNDNPNLKFEVSRFKGLGEMSAEELEETAMEPTSRILRQITIEDDIEAAETVENLMGSNPKARKEFIVNALKFEKGSI